MTTSSSTVSDTGGRSFALFVRLAAVFIGLANLVVLAGLNGVDSAILQREDVGFNEILPPVLAVVVAGIVISDIVLRLRRSALAEKFSHRYGFTVCMVCFGGTLTGFLLAAALTINRTMVPGPDALLERVMGSLIPGFVGAVFGLVLGLAEGLILAFPLAAVLGRFRNGD